jgi:hypothetical protein
MMWSLINGLDVLAQASPQIGVCLDLQLLTLISLDAVRLDLLEMAQLSRGACSYMRSGGVEAQVGLACPIDETLCSSPAGRLSSRATRPPCMVRSFASERRRRGHPQLEVTPYRG